MFRKALGAMFVTTLVALAAHSPALAQDRVEPPYIDYTVVFSTSEVQPRGSGPAPGLLAEIVAWLSGNFDLPASRELPRIGLIAAGEMAALRYRGLSSTAHGRAATKLGEAALLEQARNAAALYDDASRTIYLPEGWTGDSPAERSMLVHEMVHHLQNMAGLAYECPQAREKPAYEAQERWLALSGLNLADAVEIDPMTLLVRTNCMD
jgi:hypothetical protein